MRGEDFFATQYNWQLKKLKNNFCLQLLEQGWMKWRKIKNSVQWWAENDRYEDKSRIKAYHKYNNFSRTNT